MSALTTQTNNNQIQTVDKNLMPLAPSYVGPSAPEPQDMSLNDVLTILARRKWTILITLLTILSLVTLYTLSLKPTYRANATIQIEREGAEIVDFGRTSKPVDSVDSLNDPFFRTRYEMLRGRVVAQKVIDDLSLESSLNPKKEKSFIGKALESIGFGEAKKNTPQQRVDYTDLFFKNLFVQPISGTHLVEIFYEAGTPEEAKDVVSSIVENFITSQIQSKSETGTYAKDFLDKQIEEAGEKLKNDELTLVRYANENGILGVDENQTRQVKKLENLDSALVQAEIRRIEAESLYLQMKKRAIIKKC